MDQTAPEGEELRGRQHERGADAAVDRVVRVSSGGLHQISQSPGAIYPADFTACSAQFV